MKKYFALAAVATMFAACTNEEVTQADSLKDTPITIASAGVGELTASRTTTADVVNNPFGLFVESTSDETKYEATNMEWTYNDGWGSDETLLFEGAGKQTAYAYHPYAENATANYTFTTDGTTDLLWWKSGDALTGNSLSIEFAHALSKLTVNLKKNSEIGDVDLGDVTIGGTILTGTANLAEQTWTLDEDATASNISTTEVTATTGYDKTVEVLLLPQTAAFSVVIEVDGKTYIWTSTGQTFAPGTAYTLNLNVGKDVTSVAKVRVADWGEAQNIEGGIATECYKPFSVSADNQVTFSKGNLQYHPANNKWRFAENQTDYIGEANTNISDAYDDWIDLFGWSGNEGSANFGVSALDDHNHYKGTFVDWGSNQIGNDVSNTWRTLSKDEWVYLFQTRTNASSLYGVAQVSGVNGIVVLPDNWSAPSGLSFISGLHSNAVSDYSVYQSFTTEQWQIMEQAGAVFLPASGERSGTEVSTVGSKGNYWSSTKRADNGSYLMYFTSSSLNPQYDWRIECGYSVRLVRDLDKEAI